MDTPNGQLCLIFLNVICKWWGILNIKSVSKGKRKRDINMKPIDATNIACFLGFMNMFATWLDDWMSSGKSGFSKQTFLSCIQTSRSFTLLVQHLLESKQLSYRKYPVRSTRKKVQKVLLTQWSKLFPERKAVFRC